MLSSRKSRRATFLAVVVLLAAAGVGGYLYQRHRSLPEVQVEVIHRRDLEAIVSASGKIEPKRSVNISADTIGRVTKLAVEEGEGVERGQFLLQIDPETVASAVERSEAALNAAREAIQSALVLVKTARANLDLAEQNLERQKALYEDELVSRETLDRAETEVKVRRSEVEARETEVRAAWQRLKQQVAELRSARHNLNKVTIDAPIDGVVTRLNIKEGETVLVGTMNNPGTVLMTVADLSIIQAKLEVDETDITNVSLGQDALVTIDAFPDRELAGKVTKIGSSSLEPDLLQTQRQATLFEVEVTLEDTVSEARPGFSCTAEITTATRAKALSVPIQALTVREAYLDPEGNVHTRTHQIGWEPPPEAKIEELEGVFVLRDGRVRFTPVEIGIAGEQYFEVLSGLEEGDEVVIGPFASVRDLGDGDMIRVSDGEEPRP